MKKVINLLAALVLIFCVFSFKAQAAPLYGDTDASGNVDSLDLVVMRLHLFGMKDINTATADLDGDGKISLDDFELLRKFILGQITEFPVESSPKPKFHVFLLLGQSNMAGYPKAQASDKVEDPRILVLGYDNNPALGRVTNQWDVACPPLHDTYQGAIGPGDWFAKTLIKELPAGDTIGLVPCAINGERIETFMKSGGSKYNWIVTRAKLAQQKGGIIDGIIFHQGCSNNGDASWPGKVNTLVQDLKKDLNLGDIPFIAGELLYNGGCSGHNTLVNQLPSVVKNCHVVSASGLVVDPSDMTWRLHFSHDSQVTLGKRYAQKMIDALGW